MGGWVIKLFFFIKIPLVSSIFEEFPFPIFCLCCFLPSCLPIIKKFFIMGGWVKRWKYFGRKPVEHAANGPIWMPQDHTPLGDIHFWRVPFSHFLPLLLPSFLSPHNKEMVYYGRLLKKVEIFLNKISLTGCKWSILSAPGSEPLWCHPILKSSLFSFSAPADSFLPVSP